MDFIIPLVHRQAAMEEAARQERIRQAWLAYHGQSPPSLKRRAGAPDDNVVINYARTVVDRGVSFLLGSGVRLRVKEAPEAQEWLDRAWHENAGPVLMYRLALNGAVCGQAFLKLVEAREPGHAPRVVVLDPATVTAYWEPDDWETVTRFDITWHGVDPDDGHPVACLQRIEQHGHGRGWTVTDQRSDGTAAWQTISSHHWPYPWPPIVTCQNLPAPNEFWGLSDLEPDVLDLCRAMAAVVSNANRIVRLHAHPKVWGTGFDPDELSLDPDDVTILPTSDAALHLLEMKGDLSPSLELYRRLKDALHELTAIPEISAGALHALGRVSGVALRVLYQPLVERTRAKRLLYGQLLSELGKRLLEMGGFGSDHVVHVEWPSASPADPYQEAQTALLYTQLGLPKEEALAKLGITPLKEETCPADST